jgi:hypothetical protein
MPAAAFEAAKPAGKPAAAKIGRPPTFGFHHLCGSEKQPLANLLSGNGVSDECPMGLRPTKGDENSPSCSFNNSGHVLNGACRGGLQSAGLTLAQPS